jgi:DNA-binding NarL/FixJ family response regulator
MGGRPTYSVLVADGQPLGRDAVVSTCSRHPRLRVVGTADTGMEAFLRCVETGPDIVVLDLTLPDVDGPGLLRSLKHLGAKVCVLTARDDDKALFESVTAGADGFLPKSAGVQRLPYQLIELVEGRLCLSDTQRRTAKSYFGEMVRKGREANRVESNLSPREKDVLALFAEGLTTIQMGARLGISAVTVQSHIKRLYRKLGVNNRIQALKYAERLGLVEYEPAAVAVAGSAR